MVRETAISKKISDFPISVGVRVPGIMGLEGSRIEVVCDGVHTRMVSHRQTK